MPRPMIFSALLAAGVVLSLSSVARADRAPLPGPCDYEEEGAQCTTKGGVDGICTKEQCSRIAYKDGKRTSARYDCMKCRAKPGADGPDADASAKGEVSPPADATTSAEPAEPAPVKAASPEVAPVPAVAEAPPAKTEARGLCSIADDDDPSLAALALGLVLGVRRRRRRAS